MFIFKKKSYHEGVYNASITITYKWDIVIDNTIVGHITLDIHSPEDMGESLVFNAPNMVLRTSPMKSNAYADIYSVANYFPDIEPHIMQSMKDFKQIANDKLLDVDEDYEPLRFVEVNYGGTNIIC